MGAPGRRAAAGRARGRVHVPPARVRRGVEAGVARGGAGRRARAAPHSGRCGAPARSGFAARSQRGRARCADAGVPRGGAARAERAGGGGACGPGGPFCGLCRR